jgi:ParB family transcriptional regulator, chromosome partitioning protein
MTTAQKRAAATVAFIPLSMLRSGDDAPGGAIHVRKTAPSKEEDAQTKASLLAEGVLQSVLACRLNAKDDVFYLAIGNRRLRLLNELRDEKKIAADYAVPALIMLDVTPAQARAMSLAENIERVPLHPVDRYEAFQGMADDGQSVDAIALRFGITVKTVEQALALGRVSPLVRSHWREGKLRQQAVEAFTLSSSHKQQDQILKALLKRDAFHFNDGVHEVRSAIVGNKGSDAARFVNFVGFATYEAAGGSIIRDLFHGAHAVSDPALAKRLADEKLAAECARLVAAGWSWAKPDDQIVNKYLYGGLNKKPKPTTVEAARLKELGAIIEEVDEGNREDDQEIDDIRDEYERIENEAESRAFSAAEKARSGCGLSITRAGKLSVSYGLIPPAARTDKAGAAARSLAAGSHSTASAPAKKKPSGVLSNALVRRLHGQRDTAIKAALNAHPHKDGLGTILAHIVAKLIDPSSNLYAGHTPREIADALGKIADAVAPAVMETALVKAFDADGYFKGAPAKLRARALEEMDAPKPYPQKAAAVIKLGVDLAESKKWLPREMRTAHYRGPGVTTKRK